MKDFKDLVSTARRLSKNKFLIELEEICENQVAIRVVPLSRLIHEVATSLQDEAIEILRVHDSIKETCDKCGYRPRINENK